MTKEQIKNFNYRAFIMLLRKHEDLSKKIRTLGYDVNDIFIGDLQRPFLQLNGVFKEYLLRLYRQLFEENQNEILLKEFEELCFEFSLINKRDYQRELREIEEDMVHDIEEELQRLNKTFKRSDEKPLEFLTYDSTSNIMEIYPDGTVKLQDCDEPIGLLKLLTSGELLPYDACNLLEQIAVIK